jgi:site-specific DNA recombinase
MASTDKQAVIYLRVSTAAQAKKDRDAEGFSIPAQREACHRKAQDLGVVIVDEYVDAGESAKSADRPKLQAMLDRIKQPDHGIGYVIVHKVDRLARNRADDVAITIALKAAGIQLVSVTENIDETPSGKLLHGIMASIAEFYSANLATEVTKGMVKKLQRGGTPYQAPTGYRNVRTTLDGHDVRTVELDPDRAPLIAWAFEAYATGEHSLTTLTEQLAEMGLTTRPGARRPEKPVSRSNVAHILRNPYYMGLVRWHGQHFAGNHPPLVTVETFQTVQSILDAKHQSGERRNIRHHYLKGTLHCARCESRLSYTEVEGNGGRYAYFYCLGRQRGNGCDLPYLQPETVEELVESHWTLVELPSDRLERLRNYLLEELQKVSEQQDAQIKRARATIKKTEQQRRKLADLVLDGAIPPDIAREKQEQLQARLARATRDLQAQQIEADQAKALVLDALDLAGNCARAYEVADPEARRQWNQTFFQRLLIEPDHILAADMQPAYATPHGHRRPRRRTPTEPRADVATGLWARIC